jgi:DedD protein
MQWEKELEFKVENQGDDKEITLGPMILTALGLGVLVICCICFLIGYKVGHRAETPKSSSTTESASGYSAAELLARVSGPRPASGSTSRAAHAAPDEITGGLTPVAAAQEPAPPPPADAAPDSEPPSQKPPNAQPAVHTALPQYTSQAGSWIVQVAAVENSADADVLIGALRQRGYSVSERHGADDNLIHVQVGPFTTRSDADSMRQKLANDGYNANIEP